MESALDNPTPAPVAASPARLVLASRSPRRRALLEEGGFEHEAITPGLDDAELAPPAGTSPAAWVVALAYLKARAGMDALADRDAEPAIVLGADTVCVVDGAVTGQPRDADHARRMIEAMAGREHEVITGLALVGPEPGTREMLFDRARVRLGPIDAATRDSYVASGAWAGKAGGYNLSERLESGWPIEFEGDPGTIMGLPMRRLAPILRARLEDAAGDRAPGWRVA